MQFKFRLLVGTYEYERMHDILSPKRVCCMSRDLFKFWEISNNVLLTVQDRDIVANCNGTLVRIVCGLSNGTIANTLE